MKGNARKVRRLYKDQVIAGFAGGTAESFTLFERLRHKLEKTTRAICTRRRFELAKGLAHRTAALRRLKRLLAVAKQDASLIITGTADVIEPGEGLICIGSGGP